jgi:hypothetical protein
MFQRSKGLLFTAIAVGCVAMMMPSQAEARGGGGGGRGGGGGGGGRGGFGGFSRGGGSFSGGSGYRGFSGSTAGASRFTPNNPGSGAWRGNWNNYGRWGGRGWGYGWGVGLGYWGFGGPFWYGGWPFWYPTLGYGVYSNPYYTNATDYGGYDYGVPIQQNAQQSQQNPEGAPDNQYFAEARAAFYAGNYPEALRNIEHAAIDQPTNEDVHQFHSLVFFALGDYQKAAAVAHTVLDRGPGWNWSVVQSFYQTPDTYTEQLRKLEHYITEHPEQASTRFLLAYEYLTLGHYPAADRQLKKVVALEPKDVLAKNILNGLNNAPGVKPNTSPGTGSQPQGLTSTRMPAGPPEDGPAPPQGQPAAPSNGPAPAITGTWTASPAPGVSIKATLQPDKHFTWTFTEGGQTTNFTGTYTQQGDELVLTRDQDGQKMDGTVSMSDNGFRFRLKNTDPNDVGLQFAK